MLVAVLIASAAFVVAPVPDDAMSAATVPITPAPVAPAPAPATSTLVEPAPATPATPAMPVTFSVWESASVAICTAPAITAPSIPSQRFPFEQQTEKTNAPKIHPAPIAITEGFVSIYIKLSVMFKLLAEKSAREVGSHVNNPLAPKLPNITATKNECAAVAVARPAVR